MPCHVALRMVVDALDCTPLIGDSSGNTWVTSWAIRHFSMAFGVLALGKIGRCWIIEGKFQEIVAFLWPVEAFSVGVHFWVSFP